MKKSGDTHTDNTHPSRIIVPDGIFNSYQNFDSLGFCLLMCGYRYLRCSCHEMSPERGRRKANIIPSLSFAGPFDSIFIHRFLATNSLEISPLFLSFFETISDTTSITSYTTSLLYYSTYHPSSGRLRRLDEMN